MKYNAGYTMELMEMAIRKMVKSGLKESEIKKITANIIIEQAMEAKTTDEQLDFLLNSDFFWEGFSNQPDADEWSAEAILKRNGVYTEEKARELEEKAKNIKYKHRYNDFLNCEEKNCE